jgi:hypothetical protein
MHSHSSPLFSIPLVIHSVSLLSSLPNRVTAAVHADDTWDTIKKNQIKLPAQEEWRFLGCYAVWLLYMTARWAFQYHRIAAILARIAVSRRVTCQTS